MPPARPPAIRVMAPVDIGPPRMDKPATPARASLAGADAMTPPRGAQSEAGPGPGTPGIGGRRARIEGMETMFAVIRTGGKQYRVSAGDVLRVEKLDAAAGETVQFNEVLVAGDTVGAPLVAGAAVQAEVIDQIKGEKTINFVRRRRKHSSKRTKGHRQELTLVRVTGVLATGGDTSGVKPATGTGAARRAAAAAAKE